MTRNLPMYCSVLRNALVLVLLFAAVGLIAGCGTAPTGGSPSPTVPTIKGTFRFFTLPTTGSYLAAITAGSDGNIWFTEVTGTINGPVGKIGRITSTGSITEFPPKGLKGNLSSITVGPDGNLWFTDGGFSQGGKIGRVTPAGVIHEFPLPASNSDPSTITAGPDGNLWFTDGNPSQSAKIERITPTGAIHEFPLPSADSPGRITAGQDGSLWFTETIIGPKTQNGPGPSGQIGRITPTGMISTYHLPAGTLAVSITSGPDHNIWFAEEVMNNNGPPSNKIGRITPSGTITEFALPTGNQSGIMGVPIDITAGPDGALWFSDAANNAIGRITTTGSINEFALAAPQSAPEYITSGPGHTLWFSELNNNGQGGKLGRLTIT